jgi:hypothetical protein
MELLGYFILMHHRRVICTGYGVVVQSVGLNKGEFAVWKSQQQMCRIKLRKKYLLDVHSWCDCVNGIHLAQDRGQWRVPLRGEEFLNFLIDCYILKKSHGP